MIKVITISTANGLKCKNSYALFQNMQGFFFPFPLKSRIVKKYINSTRDIKLNPIQSPRDPPIFAKNQRQNLNSSRKSNIYVQLTNQISCSIKFISFENHDCCFIFVYLLSRDTGATSKFFNKMFNLAWYSLPQRSAG